MAEKTIDEIVKVALDLINSGELSPLPARIRVEMELLNDALPASFHQAVQSAADELKPRH